MAQTTLRRYAEAEKAIRRAIMFCPKNALSVAYVQMGNLHRAKGEFKNAAFWYRKTSKCQPEDATPHIHLGNNAFQRGQIKQAEKHFRSALVCSKGSIEEAYFNLGGILLGNRKYSETAACYREALKIDPKYKIAKERLDDAELALLIMNS